MSGMLELSKNEMEMTNGGDVRYDVKIVGEKVGKTGSMLIENIDMESVLANIKKVKTLKLSAQIGIFETRVRMVGGTKILVPEATKYVAEAEILKDGVVSWNPWLGDKTFYPKLEKALKI